MATPPLASREMDSNLSNSEEGGLPPDRAYYPQAQDFLSLTERDLAPWRDLPVSRLLEAHLLRERESGRQTVVGLISGNDIPAARIATGGVLLVESLLLAFHPPEAPPIEPEEPFVDPAEIIRPGDR